MTTSLSAFQDFLPFKNILGHRAQRETQNKAQRGLADYEGQSSGRLRQLKVAKQTPKKEETTQICK